MSASGLQDEFVEAVLHHAAGRLADADRIYRRILASDPGHAPSLHGLGMVAYQTGAYRAAADLIGQAVAAEPKVAAFRSNLGNVLKALARPDEAADSYRQAIGLDPADSISLNNLGNLLSGEGRHAEALDFYRRALAARPDDAVAENNLGNALAALGRTAEARRRYGRALELRPDYAEAHFNLGNLVADRGELDEAVARYRRALALRPDHIPAQLHLGGVLRLAGRFAEAIALYEDLLAREPDMAEALSNLGRVFMAQGRIDEAGACYERALALKPDYEAALANLLIALQYLDREPQTVFELHRRWGEMAQTGLPPPAPHVNLRDPDRRLRVGYVSADFRAHSSGWYFAPLLAAHNRGAVEVFCYADVRAPDRVTARLRGLSDHWRDTAGAPDAAVAQRIRDDRIDVLIDTNGHLANNRLKMFATRPAPVQLSWLGYLNTTGLTAIDYRIVDDITDPPGAADALATETLVRLPSGWAVFEPLTGAPAPGPPPSLASGTVTFGAFSSPAKLSEGVVDAWSEILGRTPGSRLKIKAASFDDEATKAMVLARFAARGVDPGRLDLPSWVRSATQHVALYNSVDIVLDTFPHNGVTTTCEALWMGCPVVALLGERHCSRISASFLTRVGHGEMIAGDLAGYVDLAVELASQPRRLAQLRRSLRPAMAASPICDAKGFAAEMEAAYRDMWRRWCGRAGRRP